MKSDRGNARRTRLAFSGQSGTTLVETLAALGLFAVSIAAVGNFMVHQIRTSSDNHAASLAYSVAEDALEDIRAKDFDEATSNTHTITKDRVSFTVSTVVEDHTPAANMKQITVGVAWNGPRGNDNIAVQTIYTAVKR